MRTTLVIASLACLCGSASLALAQKGGAKAAPAKGAEDEIELEDTATPDKPAGEGDGEIELEEDKPVEGNLELDQQGNDLGGPTMKAGPVTRTPISWKDILVVIRKPFLKVRRVELSPFFATTMNDNMVRHNTLGLQANYYLTDVLAVGVEGQLYTHQFREPFDLVGRQARRLPTVNEYNWSGALNFHYVPVYGKFAVLDKHLLTWEVFFTAGIGAAQSSVIPRDRTYPGFDNFLIQPNVGVSMRFFLSKFLTVTMGFRDYVFIDKFEPTDRSAAMNATADQAKSNADSAFINNVMFQLGVSIWLPMSFEYTTFR
ncbi:MAG: outer membrane beta-barrel domain-containing protein [Myxococcales bacterium]|nr:outer membrane beta-barrel domain-containing protein [Myxococcales bacterium]HRC56194.1 outer membrane beta-barrel domain-containing protein [Kofleriaceae bacterium]